MNVDYLDAAKERVTTIPLLINIVSRRVKQLNSGQRPMVKPDDLRMSKLDLALKEIAEGALTAEMNLDENKPSLTDTGESVITL